MYQGSFRGLKYRGQQGRASKNAVLSRSSSPHRARNSDLDIDGKDPEAVILAFLPIIKRIAAELVLRNPGPLDVEDLTSAGVMGLLAAMGRFDPTRETKFRTFAEYRIRGAMLDEIRAMDWVPRSVRAQIDKVNQVAAALTKKSGHQPDQGEMAEALGLSRDELAEMPVKEITLMSLDETVGDDEEFCTLKDILPARDHLDPLTACISHQIGSVLRSAISKLLERQQNVLRLYYFSGLTMKAIGELQGLTESGVCRVHAEALNRLRGDLHSQGTDVQTLTAL